MVFRAPSPDHSAYGRDGARLYRESAPANIALIKYMGKQDLVSNRPANRSLSWTTPHLLSFVELEPSSASEDRWEPLSGLCEMNLSVAGQSRFLAHLQRIKSLFNYKQNFIVRSGNGFPADCGLASSASSFAALTRAGVQAIADLQGRAPGEFSDQHLSRISQLGSGSSCRSFFSPWALWADEGAEAIEFSAPTLFHEVVVVSSETKKISSSQAHRLVASSSLYAGRPERANVRLNELIKAFQSGDWAKAHAVVWQEFWDMHALFETCQTPFGYMRAGSIATLEAVRDLWRQHQDGPLATMDAGPNVHLLYRADQEALAGELRAKLPVSARVFSSLDPEWSHHPWTTRDV